MTKPFKPPYTSMQIVSEIMRQCNLERIWMTNFRLQTTLFYIQTKALIETGEPVFEDDFEAWRVGPVIRDVYNSWNHRSCGFLCRKRKGC